MVSSQVQQAMVFVLETIKQYKDTPGINISLTGHSLGGRLASLMGVAHFNLPARILTRPPSNTGHHPSTALRALPDPAVLPVLPAEQKGYSNAAFDQYCSSPGTLYWARESNVQSYYVDGEVLEGVRIAFPAITGAGQEHEQTIGEQTANPNALHSMTLLNAILLSQEFKKGITQQTRAVEVLATTRSTRRSADCPMNRISLNLMLNQALKNADAGILDALGAVCSAWVPPAPRRWATSKTRARWP